MKMCFIHMFVYAEFEINILFLKERRSKYKPAYARGARFLILL